MAGDGTLEVLGRIDHQVKVRGVRLELGEVESALVRFPEVSAAVAVVIEDKKRGNRLVAYTACKASDVQGSRLKKRLEETLPAFLVPSTIVPLDALPLTPNGKVDRAALPMPPNEHQGDLGRLARNTDEELLVGILASVLGLPGVGAADSFFDLGGHSLMAIQVVSRVRKVFGVELPLARIFAHPTAEELAADIRDLQQGGEGLSLPPLEHFAFTADAPLSFAQQRFWFLSQLAPESSAYNISLALRLTGRLWVEHLHRSLDDLEARHEALQSRFFERRGEPRVRLVGESRNEFPVMDLSNLESSRRETTIEDLAAKEARMPFDLATEPVLRRRLVRLDEKHHVLFLTVHHIAADGWSMQILIRELAALYQAHETDSAPELAALPVQYHDFSRWQRSWLQGELLEKELGFWRDRLAGAPELLDLPTDHPRSLTRTPVAGICPLVIPARTRELLAIQAQHFGVTHFMVLLAAFQVFLARLSGQQDIVVGTPVAGRHREETEGLIGLFVNTLALRSQVRGRFETLLETVRQQSLEVFAHQELPFERLVEELQPGRNLGSTPLFQAMLAVQNRSEARLDFPGLEIEALGQSVEEAKFDFTLGLEVSANSIRGAFEFNRNLFDVSTAQRWKRTFLHLLEGLLKAPEKDTERVSALEAAERHQLLREWNDSERHLPRATLPEQLVTRAALNPAAIAAVTDAGKELSYGELVASADAVARSLCQKGVITGSFVGVCMERSLVQVIAFLGVHLAGGAYVPLDPAYPVERLEFLLRDSLAEEEVGLLLVSVEGGQAAVLDSCRELGISVMAIEPILESDCLCSDSAEASLTEREEAGADRNRRGAFRLRAPSVDLLSPAYVIYTSGSSGTPKGVVISHFSLANHLSWMEGALDLSSSDVMLLHTSMSFDGSIPEYWAVLRVGGRLVVADPVKHKDSRYLADLMSRTKVTTIQAVPSLLEALVEEDNLETCRALRLVGSGGEALTPELARKLLNRTQGRVVNLFGPTETTVDAAWWEVPSEGPGDSIPIGRPVANLKARVTSERGYSLPQGAIGELAISGVGLAQGYLRQPRLTALAFIPDALSDLPGSRCYLTGDRARWCSNGNLELLGRLDQQVKIRGFRIELGEIEEALRGLSQISGAVVVVRKSTGQLPNLVAFITCHEGLDNGNEALRDSSPQLRANSARQDLGRSLPQHLVPSAITILDEFPLTPNGKIDRQQLEEQAQLALLLRPTGTPPRNPLEQQLWGIWTDLLGQPPNGVEADFFDLGGHSLLAVRLAAHIRRYLGTTLPLASLFQASTLEAQAELLARETDSSLQKSLVLLRGNERNPVREATETTLFLVHPVGGNLFCYADLLKSLPGTISAFGLQRLPLEEPDQILSIETLASGYLDELEEVGVAGRLRLAGWSFGGVVAFEMARQLERKGRMAELVLLDSVPPIEGRRTEASDGVLVGRFLEDLLRIRGASSKVDWSRFAVDSRDSSSNLLRRAEVEGLLPEGLELEQVEALFNVFRSHELSWQAYEPKPFGGSAVLISASRGACRTVSSPALGWRPLISGKLEEVSVEGDHYSFLEAPVAEVIRWHLSCEGLQQGQMK